MDSLTQIIGAALALKQSKSAEEMPLEREFLETLAILAKSPFPEAVEKSLQALLKILQTSGQVRK